LLDLDKDHREWRWNVIGFDTLGRILRVTYTLRGEPDDPYRWLISARRAEPHDREGYARRRGNE
jgi:uncharacterized DUF497 family protein